MGATNIVVEGPTDQYLLSELVRAFVTPDNVSELLDLNAVVIWNRSWQTTGILPNCRGKPANA